MERQKAASNLTQREAGNGMEMHSALEPPAGRVPADTSIVAWRGVIGLLTSFLCLQATKRFFEAGDQVSSSQHKSQGEGDQPPLTSRGLLTCAGSEGR